MQNKTPHIKALITQSHNKRTELLQQLPPNSLLICYGAKPIKRGDGVEFGFCQNSDFYYLCPLEEPNLVIILHNIAQQPTQIISSPNYSKTSKIWEGEKMSTQQIKENFYFDDNLPKNDLQETIEKLSKNAKNVFVADVHKKKKPANHQSYKPILHKMRMCKTDLEVEIIKQACDMSAQAFAAATKLTDTISGDSEIYEYQIATIMEHTCKMLGSKRLAYSSIVAGGGNGTILHYIDNQDKLNKGDMLLVDFGCKYLNYASDITRTWAIGGGFSSLQSDLYQLVLSVQKAVIAIIKPDLAFNEMQDLAVRLITQGLVDIGLLSGNVDDLISDKKYKDFYMHSCGHYLGIDVHDVGHYDTNGIPIKLTKNMVLTVEPGIYITPDILPKKHKEFANQAIRIEDDIVVVEGGCRVLSESIFK